MSGSAQVDVWRIPLDSAAEPDSLATLDSGERERAAGFRFERDRRRFVRSHAALRGILARYAEAAPAELRFEANEHGKPRLVGEGPRFNLSHSGEWALVAVSTDCEVGVDLEVERELEYLPAARLVFHDDEVAQLEEARDRLRDDFFECWVRREAYLKGLGLGLGAAKGLEPVWRRGVSETSPRAGWRVTALRPGEGWKAALAVEAAEVRVVERELIGGGGREG
ncbi:MAG: 4'-phosphopantetheinyl transferase superfamily protein [Acidobacteriota bacterium]